MISLLGQRPRVGCFGVFDSWDSSAAECWGAAYANAELPCQAYTETLVASGIGVEANSKNTMLTAITEDTIMLANARRSAIYLDLKCRGTWRSGPPCLLPLNVLRRYIAKTIDHPKSSSIRRRITDTIWLMLHLDLSSGR